MNAKPEPRGSADEERETAAEPPPRRDSGESLLRVRDLRVCLPGGRRLLDGVDLDVAAGEIVAILGPSGSGKSTLARALFEPETLTREGMRVEVEDAQMPSAALVPQLGAPFDHLDVKGNVSLVLRWHGRGSKETDETLSSVGLGGAEVGRGRSTRGLSGGQTQRLAVARALAADRSLLFLDEPSAGLDAHATTELARLLRRQVEVGGKGAVIVTHDTLLASMAADRLLILEPTTGKLAKMPDLAGDRDALDVALRKKLEILAASGDAARDARGSSSPVVMLRRLWERTLAPLSVPPLVLASLFEIRPRHLSALSRVFLRVSAQALMRPAAFYAIVSLLLGFTVLYVLVRAAPAGLSEARLLELVGGSYVLALAPPLAALLFVATSGSAVSAWLGNLSLSKQTTALEALGIPARTYLWVPVFAALVACFLLVAAIVSAGLVYGGALLHGLEGAAGPGTIALLAGDLLDPVPERASLRLRAIWLVAIYAPGIASDVVYRGMTPKESSDAVTKGMTGSVVACTLWVVLLELLAALVLFAGEGASGP